MSDKLLEEVISRKRGEIRANPREPKVSIGLNNQTSATEIKKEKKLLI